MLTGEEKSWFAERYRGVGTTRPRRNTTISVALVGCIDPFPSSFLPEIQIKSWLMMSGKIIFGSFCARPNGTCISTTNHAGSELCFCCGSIDRNRMPSTRTIAPMIHQVALFLKIAEITSVRPPAPTASFG
jgi:hypothetical protein